jgi:uncharacterized membrane protein (UPF0127 family)
VRLAHVTYALLGSVRKTETLWERTKGLLGTKALQDGEGLLITPCNAVHTCFMTFPLGLVYLDREGNVVKLVEKLRPWRMSCCFAAARVLEVRSSVIGTSGIKIGDRIVWEMRR